MAYLHALGGVLSLLIVCLVGFVLARSGLVPKETGRLLPRFVACVALPPYLFHSIATTFAREDMRHLLLGALVPIASILLTFTVALLVARGTRVARKRFGLYCASFSCSSAVFIGIPMCDALLGPRSIPYALLYYFANAAFFWTIGSYLIASDTRRQSAFSKRQATRALLSPPLLGFALGLATALLNIELPDFVLRSAAIVGQLTTPLALLYIGFGLSLVPWRDFLSRDLLTVSTGRLVLCPLITLLVVKALGIAPYVGTVFVVQAALPAVMQAPILSAHHRTDPEFGTLVVTATTLGCILTLPIVLTLV